MEEFFRKNPNFFNNNNNNSLNNYGSMKKNRSNNNISQNSNFAPFMVAKFGKKKVISQDLNTFLNSIKQAEWTNNPSYLAAKDIGVKPTFKINNSNNNEYNNIPKYSTKIKQLLQNDSRYPILCKQFYGMCQRQTKCRDFTVLGKVPLV